MARLGRVVALGLPHHITERGNCRQQGFCDEDYQTYLELMAQRCAAHKVDVWAHCLMLNHVHVIAVPHSADDWVQPNVTRCRQQIRLIEHERSDSPLPEMPAPALARVDHTRVAATDLADRAPQSSRRFIVS
jgi:REP element-mobilizing transposase RayT